MGVAAVATPVATLSTPAADQATQGRMAAVAHAAGQLAGRLAGRLAGHSGPRQGCQAQQRPSVHLASPHLHAVLSILYWPECLIGGGSVALLPPCNQSSAACWRPTSTSSRCGRPCCTGTRRPQAEYVFICRNARDYPLTHLIGELNEQLDHLCSLRFQPDELAYLRGLRFIKSDFVDFLRIFQFQRDFITCATTPARWKSLHAGRRCM